MKKLQTLFLILFFAQFHFATAQQSCCNLTASSNTQFAEFASDAAFLKKHETPLAYTYTGVGESISFPTTDSLSGHAFMIKNEKPTDNYIILVHEWWGLNDHIKRESEKIFTEMGNVNVIAIDLYDQKVAQTPEEAGKLMQGVKPERAQAIIKGLLKKLGKKAKIGTIGWCFGGGWSLQMAMIAGKQTKACVMYYGMPEKDLTKLKTLKTDVLGIFAAQEKWISPQIVKEFEENMKKAGKKLSVHNFDAEHAFANPSSPRYNEQAAKDAYKIALTYFKSKLK